MIPEINEKSPDYHERIKIYEKIAPAPKVHVRGVQVKKSKTGRDKVVSNAKSSRNLAQGAQLPESP